MLIVTYKNNLLLHTRTLHTTQYTTHYTHYTTQPTQPTNLHYTHTNTILCVVCVDFCQSQNERKSRLLFRLQFDTHKALIH